MLFHITYEFSPEVRNEAQERFRETGGLPPEGVHLRGRWHSLGSHRGFLLVESDDAVAIGRWLQEWTDLLYFDLTPVLDDDDIQEVIG